MNTVTEKIKFIKLAFGSTKMSRDGRNVAVSCPSCGNGKKKKFSISLDTWSCHCWVCGIKGKNIYTILKNHISSDIAHKFNQKFGIATTKENDEEIIDEVAVLPDGFQLMANNMNTRDPDKRACIRYVQGRGINIRDIWYFKIGFSSSRSFRRRIIVPSFDHSGMLNYFSARTIDENSYPKYRNSKANKTNIIFNEINIDWDKEVTLVEGPFDLIKSDQNSVCLLGSVLSQNSYLFAKIIANRTPVLLALDIDMKNKAMKYAKSLSLYGCSVRILNTSPFKDVGEMSRDDFLIRKKESVIWSPESNIINKISQISTGSLF